MLPPITLLENWNAENLMGNKQSVSAQVAERRQILEKIMIDDIQAIQKQNEMIIECNEEMKNCKTEEEVRLVKIKYGLSLYTH